MTDHEHDPNTPVRALWIPAAESSPMQYIEVEREGMLRSFQNLVAGPVEPIVTTYRRLNCGCSVWMLANENGRMLQLPLNRRAQGVRWTVGPIYGDVVIVASGSIGKDEDNESIMDWVSLPSDFDSTTPVSG